MTDLGQRNMTPAEERAWQEMAATGQLRAYLWRRREDSHHDYAAELDRRVAKHTGGSRS